MERTFLTDQQVAERYGVSRFTIWRWHRTNPDFPRVTKLGPAASRWRLEDLEQWEATLETAA